MSNPELERLGWSDLQEQDLASLRESGAGSKRTLVPARVVIRHNRIYTVTDGMSEFHAHLGGRLRYSARSSLHLPAAGDWVAVERGRGALIRHVLARRTALVRKAAGTSSEPQLLAANVDLVLVVSSFDGNYNPNRIERYLKLAADCAIPATVVLNKSDLSTDPVALVKEVGRRNPGTTVVHASAQIGTGMKDLEALLRPTATIALLGSSGVGKSSIVNYLAGADRQRVGEVRDSDTKGRHTTTHRELVVLPGGVILVDTPGMRELQLWQEETDEATIDNFSDIEELAASCRFSNCTHDHEPDCAVTAAVKSGALDAQRVSNYRKMQTELTYLARRKERQSKSERGLVDSTAGADLTRRKPRAAGPRSGGAAGARGTGRPRSR